MWLLVAGVVALTLLYYRPVHAYLTTRHTLAKRSAEVRALADEKRALEQRLAASQTGSALIRAARRLGLVRPGERLFIVKDIASWRHAGDARSTR